MNNYKNIIVGLDISKNSIDVLNRAFLIASESKAKIIIVHAIESSWFSELFSDSNLNELKQHALKTIEEKLKQIDTKNLDFEILIDEETSSTYVVDCAKKVNADLIIVGANEKEEKEIIFLGSTAHRIAQNSNIPLLIVKTSCIKPYENIVAFTDLSEVSKKSIGFANDFFKTKDIKVVYIYKQISEIAFGYYNEVPNKDKIRLGIQKKEQQKFDIFVKKNNIENAHLVEGSSGINGELVDYAHKNKNDLVILGSRGVNNSSSLIFGSSSSYLMENLKNDVLVFVPED